jgi:chromate transporter
MPPPEPPDLPGAPTMAVARARRDAPASRPESLAALFWSFSGLALQGFGGVLAVVQRELVERRRWLSREEFIEDWAVAQILPGPNVINLSLMLGDRYFGLRGAFTALAGMLLFPLVILLLLASFFTLVADQPLAQGALRGMGAVAAGLIAATGLRLTTALRSNVMGLPACWLLAVLTFVAVALFRLPLAGVLLGLGGLACGWAWWRIGLGERPKQRHVPDAGPPP